MLNSQFTSVFTTENTINMPSKGNSPFKPMKDIKISAFFKYWNYVGMFPILWYLACADRLLIIFCKNRCDDIGCLFKYSYWNFVGAGYQGNKTQWGLALLRTTVY
jgi:hypothetical protein